MADRPKRGDFKAWADVAAGSLAAGSETKYLRALLKATSEKTWAYVNWLTHARRATEFDARVACGMTSQITEAFVTAVTRWRLGAPERCPACGSYQLRLDYIDDEWAKLCSACGRMCWATRFFGMLVTWWVGTLGLGVATKKRRKVRGLAGWPGCWRKGPCAGMRGHGNGEVGGGRGGWAGLDGDTRARDVPGRGPRCPCVKAPERVGCLRSWSDRVQSRRRGRLDWRLGGGRSPHWLRGDTPRAPRRPPLAEARERARQE